MPPATELPDDEERPPAEWWEGAHLRVECAAGDLDGRALYRFVGAESCGLEYMLAWPD
jgi:hypothetical protein